MYSNFGDDVYIPLNERLCRFVEETGELHLDEIDKTNKLKIFTFIDNTKICEICKEAVDEINSWITKHRLMKFSRVTWVIEPEMDENLICKEIGISTSPTTFFCDKYGNIKDIITGRPSQTWMDTYILPLLENQ